MKIKNGTDLAKSRFGFRMKKGCIDSDVPLSTACACAGQQWCRAFNGQSYKQDPGSQINRLICPQHMSAEENKCNASGQVNPGRPSGRVVSLLPSLSVLPKVCAGRSRVPPFVFFPLLSKVFYAVP